MTFVERNMCRKQRYVYQTGSETYFRASHLQVPIIYRETNTGVTWPCFYKIGKDILTSVKTIVSFLLQSLFAFLLLWARSDVPCGHFGVQLTGESAGTLWIQQNIFTWFSSFVYHSYCQVSQCRDFQRFTYLPLTTAPH